MTTAWLNFYSSELSWLRLFLSSSVDFLFCTEKRSKLPCKVWVEKAFCIYHDHVGEFQIFFKHFLGGKENSTLDSKYVKIFEAPYNRGPLPKFLPTRPPSHGWIDLFWTTLFKWKRLVIGLYLDSWSSRAGLYVVKTATYGIFLSRK